MPSPLYQRAIDPHQYDLPDLHWESELGLGAPTRKFFYDCLLHFKHLWVGADVLDVGCGTGWLADLIKQSGAHWVEGFDPSANNIRLGHQHFPNIHLHLSDLAQFNSNRKYDLILVVMVFGHVADVTAAFKRLAAWLKPTGEIQIIVPDFVYFKKPRSLQNAKYEDISDEEYISQITREQGVLSDIVRTVSYYNRVANLAGLSMIEDLGLTPTRDLITSLPRYKKFKNIPIARLDRFKLAGT